MTLRPLAAVLAIAVGLCGCPRAVRPELGEDRTVTTGIEVRVGSADPKAPKVSFDFGDGSPPVLGREARHAYSRGGSYAISARQGEVELSRVRLTVVPRPLLDAVPREASSILFLPKVAGHLEAAIDFLEKLLGAEAVQNLLDETVLPGLAIELPSNEAPAIDVQEGLGLFTLPQLDGVVGLLGVVDAPRAQEALIRQLVRQGGQLRSEPDGTVRVRMPQGRELAVFEDRGYLFVVIPESEEPLDFATTLVAVRKSPDQGLSATGAIARGKAGLGPADVYAFLVPPPSPTRALDGLFAGLIFADRALEIDGVIRAEAPLWSAGTAPVSSLLSTAPEGAIAAVSVSAAPAALVSAAIGEPGTPRRLEAARRARRGGMDLEALLFALAGDLAALVYFDAEGFLANLAAGTEKPEPRGTLLLQAGLTRLAPVQQWIEAQLLAAAIRHDRIEEREQTRYLGRLHGQPIELQLEATRARLAAGADVRRPPGNLVNALRGRFAGAFGPGHLSVMIDLGQLRKELAEPRNIPGVDPRRLVMVQGFASAFMQQLTPIDHLFLDVSPDPVGGRLKGRLVLREK